jgi:hypothetical protein
MRSINVVPEDPTDNRILECAFAGRSRYPVTGDTAGCTGAVPCPEFFDVFEDDDVKLAIPALLRTIYARPGSVFSTGLPPLASERCLQSGENQTRGNMLTGNRLGERWAVSGLFASCIAGLPDRD